MFKTVVRCAVLLRGRAVDYTTWVCLRAPCDIPITRNSPNDAFLRATHHHEATHDCCVCTSGPCFLRRSSGEALCCGPSYAPAWQHHRAHFRRWGRKETRAQDMFTAGVNMFPDWLQEKTSHSEKLGHELIKFLFPALILNFLVLPLLAALCC
jgi:hypothetical protein